MFRETFLPRSIEKSAPPPLSAESWWRRSRGSLWWRSPTWRARRGCCPMGSGQDFLLSIFSFVFCWLLPHGIWARFFFYFPSFHLFFIGCCPTGSDHAFFYSSFFYWMLSQWINNSLIKHLDTDGVSSHLVKVWILSCCAVEELSPEQLPVEGERGLTFLYFPADSRTTSWWEWFLSTCRDLRGRDKINENDYSQPVEIWEGVIKTMRMRWSDENDPSQPVEIWEGVIK